MIEHDDYRAMVEQGLVPLDEKPIAMPSASNTLLVWYGLYCLAAWVIGALLVGGIVLCR